MPTLENLENRFTYHAPKDNQAYRYRTIRIYALEFSKVLNDLCPNTRELELALTRLEESVMWANASIARNK